MVHYRAAVTALLLLLQLLHPALSLYIPAPYEQIRSVKSSAHKGTATTSTVTHSGSNEMNLTKRGATIKIYIGNLAKRGGSIDMFLGKTAKASARTAIQIAKKNPYTALGISGAAAVRGSYSLYKFVQKHSDHDEDKRWKRKRHSKRRNDVTRDEKEDSSFQKRGARAKLSYSQRTKATMKSKKGKIMIGAIVIKGAATVGFLYYLRHKKQKQAQLQKYNLTHRPLFQQANSGPDDLISSSSSV